MISHYCAKIMNGGSGWPSYLPKTISPARILSPFDPCPQKGNAMKRMMCVLLCICMLLCLTACGKNTEQTKETASTATDDQTPTESQPTTDAQLPTESQPTTEATGTQDDVPGNEIKPLTLEKALYTYYEWDDELPQALVRSEHSTVTLSQEAAQAYPEMAQALSQIATMQENAMLDEFDNLISFARDELDADRNSFVTNVSTLDVQVRRADSLVISLLSDSYSHYGQIENYRVFHGTNYDTQSGKELMLNDVATVNNDLAQAVETELTTSMWAGDFYSETAVEDYFANTPYDGFSWTIDYLGVTFYFASGDLSDDGMLTATVPFAKYPELFNEKYLAAPTEYAVEIPLDISFFAELNTHDGLEAISVSGWYNEERNAYMDYGIYTDTDGQYYQEECFFHDLHPYYVKTANGNYVYLFCEDFEEGWRQMKLTVFSLNADGSVTKLGERNVSPSWLADNKFIVPTDPGCFILDDLDNETEKTAFTVGSDGMPQQAE